jgi:hypothetical protein
MPRNGTEHVAAGLWSRLNRWEWPEIDSQLRIRIMGAICQCIGIKRCLWNWNNRDDQQDA